MPRTRENPFFKGAIHMSSLSSLHRRFSKNERTDLVLCSTTSSSSTSTATTLPKVSSCTVPGRKRRSTLIEGAKSAWETQISSTPLPMSIVPLKDELPDKEKRRRRWSWLSQSHEGLVPAPLNIKKTGSTSIAAKEAVVIKSTNSCRSTDLVTRISLSDKALPVHPPLESFLTALSHSIISSTTNPSSAPPAPPLAAPVPLRPPRPHILDLATLHQILETHTTDWTRASVSTELHPAPLSQEQNFPAREIVEDGIPSEACLRERRIRILRTLRENTGERLRRMESLGENPETPAPVIGADGVREGVGDVLEDSVGDMAGGMRVDVREVSSLPRTDLITEISLDCLFGSNDEDLGMDLSREDIPLRVSPEWRWGGDGIWRDRATCDVLPSSM